MDKVYKDRRRMLRYYLKSAKSDLTKMYWMGRLDELKRLRKLHAQS